MPIYTGKKTVSEIMGDTTFTSKKKVGNNTVAWSNEKTECIRFHKTDIIIKNLKTKNVVLNSGGWKTTTTKDRLNALMPKGFGYIKQKNGIWFYNFKNKEYPFYDGMVINSKGLPVKIKKGIVATQEKVIKLITDYCKDMKKVFNTTGVPMPSSGDCWFCSFKEVETGKSWGEITKNNNDHLMEHLKEKYIHGSLIINALRNGGYKNEQMGYIIHSKMYDTIIRNVRKYFKKHLGVAA